MDEQSSTDPSGATDPPPPAWRWETTASLGLLLSLALMAFVPSIPIFLMGLIRREAELMLPVSLLAFGLVLGYSGAHQGGRANRIVAAVAALFHLFLLMMLLFMPILD